MDFITRLPTLQRYHDYIWVIVDRLTKVAHFLPIHTDYEMSQYEQLFITVIVKLYGGPINIMSDRDMIFMSPLLAELSGGHGQRFVVKYRLLSTD